MGFIKCPKQLFAYFTRNLSYACGRSGFVVLVMNDNVHIELPSLVEKTIIINVCYLLANLALHHLGL